MRIEIDEDLEKILEEIKRQNWKITGRGHTETVRFLADYYLTNRSIDNLIDENMKRIPEHIEKALRKCLRDVIINLFNVAGEEALKVSDRRSS